MSVHVLASEQTKSTAETADKIIKLLCTFLYYARAVDPTLIMPVHVLASKQTRATTEIAGKIIKLLNDCTAHPEATLHYHASAMILNVRSDAWYMS
jgi:hypothetical protein